ncbi:MAG: hypothetical protein A2Y97_08985 [Nitrospirae bacterium RBG_13_39_12]|nr:MAG: hypothetical protein A2Y97_08985 [Nitrospirae bacterium RBG_13_39_12]
MKKLFLLFFAISISTIIFFNTVFSEDNKNLIFKKQPEIQQVKPKKPVKIKLKRSNDGKYTWELTGDDADEIINTDKRLRKLLSSQ